MSSRGITGELEVVLGWPLLSVILQRVRGWQFVMKILRW